MANILLTDYCNRSCAYCFAGGKIKRNKSAVIENGDHISIPNLIQTVKFLKRSGIPIFTAIGGEPTLHPEFQYIVNYVLSEGLPVKIFSNGIINEDKLEYINTLQNGKINLVININHPDESPKRQRKKIENTFKAIPDKVSLGFNIYKKNFEPDFLIELINKYNLVKNIRLGLSQPIYDGNNAYIPIEEYGCISEIVVDLSKKCNQYDIGLGFDCGFVMCMFSEKQLGTLYYNGCPFRFVCDPIIDIGPKLDIWRCFPLSKIMNKRLHDFVNRDGFVDYYNRKTFAYRPVGAMDKCFGCKHLRNGLCSGGCLSHTINRFKHYNINPDIAGLV